MLRTWISRFALLLLLVSHSPSRAQSALATITTLSVAPSGSVPAEQVVTLTAAVTDSSSNPVLHGTVTFHDGNVALGTTYLISNPSSGFTAGTAIFRTRSLAQGSHSLAATFNGTAADLSSTSGSQRLTVGAPAGPYPSTTVLTSTGNTNGQYGLSATVGGFGPFAPSGNITFADITASSTLATQPLTTGSWGLLQVFSSALPVCSGATAAAAGDFNNDGNLDVALAGSCNPSGFLTTMLGSGNGTFSPAASVASLGTIYQPSQIAVADFNGDGNLDAAVLANTEIEVFPGNGDGTFQSPISLSVPASFPAGLLTVGNFTGSGIPDLALVTLSALTLSISVLPNQGDGTFGAPITTSVDVTGSVMYSQTFGGPEPTLAIAAGDLNNDGITDIAMATGNSVVVFLGNSNGTFQSPSFFEDGDQAGPGSKCGEGYFCQSVQSGISITLADLHGNGHLDIIVGSEGTGTASGDFNSQISVLPGNGTGSFPTFATYSLPNTTDAINDTFNANPAALITGDFTYNGNPGVLALGLDSNFLLAGNAGGSFQAPVSVSFPEVGTGSLPYSISIRVAAGDFANNGNVDLAVPTYSSNNSPFLGLFEPAFLETASLPNVTVPGSGLQQVDADYSGDTNFAQSTSNSVPLDTRTPTTVAVSLANVDGLLTSTALTGYSTTLVATVATAAGQPAPTGTIQFYGNGVALGSPVTMIGGSASFSTSWSSAGYEYITAAYSGDANYQAETSTSRLQINVVAQAAPLVMPENQPTQALSGTPFTVNVSVLRTAAGPLPAGTVTAQLGSTSLAQGTLSGNPSSANLTLNTSAQPIPVSPQANLTYCYSGNAPWTATCTGSSIQITGTTSLSISYSGSSTITSGSPLAITGQLTTNQSGVPPTGTVTLLDNGKAIGSSTLSGGSPFVLSFTINTLTAPLPSGSHVLSFNYNGDTNWSGSISSTVTVTAAATDAVTLSSNLPSTLEALAGATVQFTAGVSALGSNITPTGTVQFYDGSTMIGAPVSVSSGAASYTSSSFATGQHSVTAHYSGDSNYAAKVGGPIAFTVVTQGQTAINFTFGSSENPLLRVTSLPIRVILSESPTILGAVPSGTITVTNNGTVVASAPVSGGTGATINLNLDGPGFTLGANSMTVSYAGNGTWGSSNYSQNYGITQGQTAFSTFSCSAGQSPAGGIIVCSANFSWSFPGGGPIPTGAISLLDGGNPIGSMAIGGTSPFYVSIRVSGTSSPLAAGTHVFSMSYPGDVSWQNAASTTQSITINPDVPTFTLTSSLGSYGSVVQGTPVTLTTTASNNLAGTPTGTVQFYIDGTAVGSPVTMSGGVAAYTTSSLGAGQHTITAAYSGSDYYSGTTTNGVIAVVTQGGDSIAIGLTGPATVSMGVPVTVTGTLTAGALGPALTGNVTLFDGATSLATATLSGSAPASVSFNVNTAAQPLVAGTHNFSLKYAGTPQWVASTSSTAAVTVNGVVTGGTYSLSATSPTVAAGSSGKSTVTVSTSNSYAGTITLSCTLTSSPGVAKDLPTCVGNPTVNLSASEVSGVGTFTVNTTSDTSAMVLPQPVSGKRWGGAGSGVALAVLILIWVPKGRRNWGSILGVVIAIVVLSGMVACGGGGNANGVGSGGSTNNPGTSAGIYTFTVSGAGNDSAKTTATTTFTLTVN